MTHGVRDLAVLARDAAMSTTYKPALLKAIVRLQHDGARKSVSLAEIANQFVELYWTQTVVFHLRQASTLAKEPEVLRALRTAASKANTRRLPDLSDVERDSLAFSISKTLRINVLRLFHKRYSAGAPPLFSWDEGEAIAFTPGAVARSCDIGSGIVTGWSRRYSQRRLPGMRCQSYPCGTENLAMPRFTWPAMSSYSLRPIARTRAVDDALLLKANSADIPSVRKRTSSIGASESPTSVMFPSRDVTDIATISPGSATVVKRAAF